MTKKIEKCPEGGEGVVVKIKPDNLLPKDYSRCISVYCPAQDCSRLQSYLYEKEEDEVILMSDFGKDKKIESKEDCEFYI
jgi:hypothetical protein